MVGPRHHSTGLAQSGPALQTPSAGAGAPLAHLASGKRGLKRGLKGRKRTVCLFVDSTIFNEIPPLRACWAPIGQQAVVPILGQHRDKRILTGVLNIQTGTYLQYFSQTYTQDTFHRVLHHTRRHWRGWKIVLFLDRISAQWAGSSRQLARQLGIELRWLPKACPELNPVDHLWRDLKKGALANEPLPDLEATLKRAWSYLADLSPHDRLRKAGVLSGRFWLRDVFPAKV